MVSEFLTVIQRKSIFLTEDTLNILKNVLRVTDTTMTTKSFEAISSFLNGSTDADKRRMFEFCCSADMVYNLEEVILGSNVDETISGFAVLSDLIT